MADIELKNVGEQSPLSPLDKYLHINAETGAMEWSKVTGGGGGGSTNYITVNGFGTCTAIPNAGYEIDTWTDSGRGKKLNLIVHLLLNLN